MSLLAVSCLAAQGPRGHTAQREESWRSSVVDVSMSLPGSNHDSGSRKRPLEAPNEAGAAAGSPGTTGTEGGNDGDRDPYGEDDDIFDEAHLPNDTMATVLALQKEFYGDGKNSASGARPSGERTGVVLQHQMYANHVAVTCSLCFHCRNSLMVTTPPCFGCFKLTTPFGAPRWRHFYST